VLHLDVQFVALTTASAPSLIANDELTGLHWFGDRDLNPLTSAAAELVGTNRAAASLLR